MTGDGKQVAWEALVLIVHYYINTGATCFSVVYFPINSQNLRVQIACGNKKACDPHASDCQKKSKIMLFALKKRL